jgi:adenylate cyclase class 2
LIEVEVKIQISDPSSLRLEFEKLGGMYILSLSHEDTYYNMPKGLRDFAISDEALRIRKSIEYNKNIKGKNETYFCFLTYKGKKIDKISKSRQEIEIKVDNAEGLKEILSFLGFREIFAVKKERELYEFEYEGNTIEALIDYLPALKAHFLEVELSAQSTKELNEKRDLLFKFLSQFGYSENDSIRKSYLELILQKSFKKNH